LDSTALVDVSQDGPLSRDPRPQSAPITCSCVSRILRRAPRTSARAPTAATATMSTDRTSHPHPFCHCAAPGWLGAVRSVAEVGCVSCGVGGHPGVLLAVVAARWSGAHRAVARAR